MWVHLLWDSILLDVYTLWDSILLDVYTLWDSILLDVYTLWDSILLDVYTLWDSILLDVYQGVFLGKKFRGGKPMFQEIERGHRLELKYVMYFVASASLAYSSCLILHSVCAN